MWRCHSRGRGGVFLFSPFLFSKELGFLLCRLPELLVGVCLPHKPAGGIVWRRLRLQASLSRTGSFLHSDLTVCQAGESHAELGDRALPSCPSPFATLHGWPPGGIPPPPTPRSTTGSIWTWRWLTPC